MNRALRLHTKYVYGGLTFCLVVLAGVSGYFYGQYIQKNNYATFIKSFRNIRENTDKYDFINPLIGGASAPATDVGIYLDLKESIIDSLSEDEHKGNLYSYSLYFRDLGTGFWFGIDESDNFSPASLFKLPISIATYKQGEDDPSFLKKEVVYTEEISKMNSSVKSNSESGLVIGKSYSVEDLVEIMITQSDNGAKDLLLTVIDKSYLNKLFALVALADPQTSSVYQISAVKYALFLRVLYGASYLNNDNSERILGYLAKSTFGDGLVAGLPKNIPVAHKFGVYEFDGTVNGIITHVQQLHDCGVIYHAKKPYILCIMTKGKDLPSLYTVIAKASKLIYEDQERNNHETQ